MVAISRKGNKTFVVIHLSHLLWVAFCSKLMKILTWNDVPLSLLFTLEWHFVLLIPVCGQYVCYNFHMKSFL
jgi:hypothetical protein